MAHVSSRPRLVATDLDGTLLRSDGTVSPATRKVLGALDEGGIPVVFVTARPLRWMGHLWSLVGSHGRAIVSNGALVHDVAADRATATFGLEQALGLAVVARIRTALPGTSFAIELPSGLRRDPDYVTRDPASLDAPVGDLAVLWDEPALKLLVRHEEGDPAAMQAAVATAVGSAATATWSSPDLAEISAPGVTKASTLARVAGDLGVASDEVLAFGDAPNDVAMLEWAGVSYAMANAVGDVHAAADRVAPTNDDDGVAQVLRQLFGL